MYYRPEAVGMRASGYTTLNFELTAGVA